MRSYLEALSANSVDIGFSNVVSLILAKAAGIDIVAITGGPIEDKTHP
jgi:ABC-type nitrate/sulfonate/bicarbonate transport system substrate-binding protein